MYLADMSGDGLVDIVRIRNGQICYWPNLGYGRFGTQVVMDGAPSLDHPDQLRPAPHPARRHRRQRHHRPDLPRTRAGRGCGSTAAATRGARPASCRSRSPPATSARSRSPTCSATEPHAWSGRRTCRRTPRRPLRYLDLMGGSKPHLMHRDAQQPRRGDDGRVRRLDHVLPARPGGRHAMGDAVAVPCALRRAGHRHRRATQDRRSPRPTATTTGTSTASSASSAASAASNRSTRSASTTSRPPTATARSSRRITGSTRHRSRPPRGSTPGSAADRRHMLGLFEREYFPHFGRRGRLRSLCFRARRHPSSTAPSGVRRMRACKGMPLRQEVAELDVAAFHDHGEQVPVRLFSAAQHGCHIRRVQPRGPNRHAVFLVVESEALTYHYELALGGDDVPEPDPRVAHTLNLRFDDYGRPRQSVAAVYPRLGRPRGRCAERATARPDPRGAERRECTWPTPRRASPTSCRQVTSTRTGMPAAVRGAHVRAHRRRHRRRASSTCRRPSARDP